MVSFGLVGPTEPSRVGKRELPTREVAKLFPPMQVPAPSLRRLRMCGGHPCAPWRRQTLTCCASSRCCFLRTGRKQYMRDSFRLRYPCGVILSRWSLSLAAQPDPRAPRPARDKPGRVAARSQCACAVAVGGAGAGGRAGRLVGPGPRWAGRCGRFPWLSPFLSS